MATYEDQATLRVGPYARISDDDEQLGLGVNRQLTDISRLLQGRYEAAEPYVDNDVSAYQPGVVREHFERLLSDFTSGAIDGIAPYDLDRLARKPTDLERIIDAYDDAVKRGRRVVFLTVQGNIDLATPDGRTMARVLIAFANKASMDTARRVSRKKLERAMNGEGTSNYRAFGWNDDGTLKDDEAQHIRQACQDVLNGIGLFVICSRLNREGIKTVRGSTWKTSAMRRILNAPRLAGLSVYKGETLIGEDGPVKGKWTPILSEDEWRAVVEALESNKRVKAQRKHSYLLTNIARCGLCGAGMVGGTPSPGRIRYMCRSTDSGGCAKVGIVGNRLDAMITELVLAYLKDRTIETGDDVWEGEARLALVTAQIGELMGQYRSGKLSGGLVFPEINKLEDEQRTLQAERGRFTRTHRTTTITGEWPDLNLEEKRAVILSVLQAVVIRPTGRTGTFDPERVEAIWR